MVMEVFDQDLEPLKRALSKDISMVGPNSVGLMFHVTRIRCVHDVVSGVWENVVFVEANQPRVEGWFLSLLPIQGSSSPSGGTKDD